MKVDIVTIVPIHLSVTLILRTTLLLNREVLPKGKLLKTLRLYAGSRRRPTNDHTEWKREYEDS